MASPTASQPISRTSKEYVEAVTWLYDRINYEKLTQSGSNYRFTLDRMRELVRRMGHGERLASCLDHPTETRQTTLDQIVAAELAKAISPPRNAGSPLVVHLAGTKGKGSVATMVSTMLVAAGHRVGLYTSPHLIHLEERFRVNHAPATPGQMVALLDSAKQWVDAMTSEPIGAPSFFELTTAIAIEHFHRERCDIWVLETGLGGRLDSTNVFQSDLTAITSIGLDHQHVLGDTLEKIAAEKAGILKPGVPVISGVSDEPSRSVIRQTAESVGAPIEELGHQFDFEVISENERPQNDASKGLDASQSEPREDDWGTGFRFRRFDQSKNSAQSTQGRVIKLSLEGRHQARNAALAIALFDHIVRNSESSDLEERRGNSLAALERLQIDARQERFQLSDNVTVVLDAAHNADSMEALVRTIERRFGDQRVVVVFGTSVDKSASVMLGQLFPVTDHCVLTQYAGNPRFSPVEQLAEVASDMANASGKQHWFTIMPNPVAALDQAVQLATQTIEPDDFLGSNERGGVVIVCGSFFLAAELRPEIQRLVDSISKASST